MEPVGFGGYFENEVSFAMTRILLSQHILRIFFKCDVLLDCCMLIEPMQHKKNEDQRHRWQKGGSKALAHQFEGEKQTMGPIK